MTCDDQPASPIPLLGKIQWRGVRKICWVLFAVGLLAGCDQPVKTQAEVRPVRTQAVWTEILSDSPTQVGEIRPHFESDLGFKIAGKVISRVTQLGTVVKRGDVVARLDEQDKRNELLAAKADLASAQASVAKTSAEERRQGKLRQDGWATEAAYESALQAADSAKASLHAAEAKLKLASDQLDYAWLRAPEDGVVTALGAEVGQVVAAGQLVVRLARLDRKDAVFSIAENMVATVQNKPAVEVWLLDTPAVRASGTMVEISPSADPTTRTYTVKVPLSDAPAAMRFGMTVMGRIHTGSRPVVSLPGSALFQQDGQPAVWVVDRSSMTVSLVKVTLFRVDPDRILVADGLTDGALVVTAGIQKLRPGQKVRLLDKTEKQDVGAKGSAS